MKQNEQEDGREKRSWFFDRAIMGFVLILLAVFTFLNQEMISWKMDAHVGERYSGMLVLSTCLIVGALGFMWVLRAFLKPYKKEPPDTPAKKSKNPLKEYEEGNKLAQEYFKGSWVASSIFFPICFGLIGVSFTKHTLPLEWYELLPLAGASLSLFIFCWGYTNRYAQYSRSIWKRLQKIEVDENMHLHRQIKKDDHLRPIEWRIKHLNYAIFGALVFLWFLRLWFSPL